jgi:hypothetical protein
VSRSPRPPPQLRVAGRYRILEELSSGGMGTVYAALDESSGARVALKRLGSTRPNGVTRRKGRPGEDASLRFQLEYAMLSRLRHPSIIDVYEYGIDHGTPYYTMELLDGQDLREVAPVPYREACRHVRDVASSLALLHAHRLVHRDVSPRNVRVTAEGRSKLFDFGTLTPFGVPPDIAGTPSCVPPEALNGSPIDHRADLYSLGAVLYWLLTAREPVPARYIDDLPAMLEREIVAPSALVDCPAELEALVLSMLGRDPLARPSSAAEVIERLDALAQLEPEPQNDVVHGYMLSAKTVGRAHEVSIVGRAIERAVFTRGGGVLVVGERGLGKTRLAREAAREAELRGATVLFVDAALHEGPFETAALVGRRLLQASPIDAAIACGGDAPYLCELVPELCERLGVEPGAAPGSSGERRSRLHAALLSWVLAYAERRPLVVVVDDLDRADEASIRFVTSLCREAARRRLLVVATARADRAARVPRSGFQDEVRLAPLDFDAVAELASSLFGDAPHVRRFARGLHEQSAGSPACCMELVTHLVDGRVVRYAGGAWVLPEASLVDALAVNLEEASAARLSRLRPAARSLAEALSVANTALPLSLCLWLVHADVEPRAAMLLLDELVSEGILVGSAGQYRFADDALRQALLAELGDERRRTLHLELGEALVRAGGARAFDSITAGWHLLRGGDENRGADLLASAARRLLLETDDVQAAVPALEAALAVYRSHGRQAHELSFLVGPLAAAGFFVDARLARRHGLEALRLFSDAIGLANAAGLEPSLGKERALGVAVATATIERRLSRGDATQASTHELFEMFFRCALSVAGASAVCLDSEGLDAVAHALEPLAHLGEHHAGPWLGRYATALRDLCEGRFGPAREALRAIEERFSDGGGSCPLGRGSRRLLVGGALFALGAMAVQEGDDDALAYAERLDGLGLHFFDMVAEQLRMLHHAFRGDVARVRKLRDRIDARAVTRGAVWQIELWEACAMLLVHVRENDVMGLKLTAERLEALAREIPSFGRLAAVARGAHLKLRGELERAEQLLAGVVSDAGAPRFVGFPTAVGLLAEIYVAKGDFRAAERITRGLERCAREARPAASRATLPAQILHAHALAGLGEASAARKELDRLYEAAAREHDPVALGLLHRGSAQLALAEGDAALFSAHLSAMEELFRPTENPALVSMCERLRHEFRRSRTARSGEYSMNPEEVVSPPRRSQGE